ncbi:MAG: acyltransferase domain-containing protein, partial [Gemmataceae bacterium]
ASLGLFHLLTRLGVRADLFAGHSYGDYTALCAAGALTAEELIRLSYERGRIILEATQRMPGAMAAIEADFDSVSSVLNEIDGVMAANVNSPKQTVISGTEEGIAAALERFRKHGIRGQRLPAACAFHSPLVAAASEPFAAFLRQQSFKTPHNPVYANTTATPYPRAAARMVEVLSGHLTSPVRFRDEIEAMYAAGARIFVEVGPRSVLTALVGQTLADRPHLAVASDVKGRPGLVQLQHLLGQLLVHGADVRIDRLHDGRNPRRLDLSNLERDSAPAKLSPSTWIVNSVRARPVNGPEPKLLGQAGANGRVEGTATSPPLALSRSASAAPLASIPKDETTQVMLRFQEMMSRFLDTQRSVMLSYLQGGEPPGSVPNLPAAALHTANGHGGNGHPTAPPVPIAVESPPHAAPTEERTQSAPVVTALDRDAVMARLLDIVCKRTGYPAEMLGLDLDLEADLGIDSIKRVEILGLLAEGNGAATLNVAMEKLTNIKSLRGIIDCLAAAPGVRGQGSG